MKMTRKILSVILIISLVFIVLQTSVIATDLDLNSILSGTIPEIENITNENAVETNNITNVVNTNNNQSPDETLPKTGVTENYAIISFAVICGVSAIYAYRKVKNYNIK